MNLFYYFIIFIFSVFVSNISSEPIATPVEENFFKLEDQIVESAAKKKQNTISAPSKIISISGEQIYLRGYRTLIDLLQDIPGTDFNTFNDAGESNTRFGLRGLFSSGQSQILIMENGIIQNDISQGWMRHIGFDSVQSDIDRIEIILGPGSALYGTNAYIGLINIITKKGDSLFKKNSTYFEGRAMAGKYNTKALDAHLAHNFENGLILQLAGRQYKTDGDRGIGRFDNGHYFSNNFEPDRVTTTEYGTVNNDRYPINARKPLKDGFNNSVNDYFFRGTLSHKDFTVGVNTWNLREGLGSYVPSYEYFTNTDGIPYLKNHSGTYAYAAHETNLSDRLTISTKLYYRNTNILPDTGFVYTYQFQSIDQPTNARGTSLSPVPDKQKAYRNQSFMTGFQQQYTYKLLDSNDIIMGVFYEKYQKADSDSSGISLGKKQDLSSNITEFSWENQPNWGYQKPSTQYIYYSSNAAIYLQDEQRFWNNKLALTAGARFDKDSSYGNVLTPRMGFTGNPINNLNFKLLYGEAFQAPTSVQLYHEFNGNIYLKPQKIKTYEFEISYYVIRSLKLTGGYFISLLNDVIANAPNPNDGKYLIGPANQHASYYQNGNPTHIYGFLWEINFDWTKNFSSYLNATITENRDRKTPLNVLANANGRITSIEPVYDGHEIDGIARNKVNVGFNLFLFNRINFNLRANWVDRRKAAGGNRYFQPYNFDFARRNYDYMNEGIKADGYLPSYTIINLTITGRNLFESIQLEPQLIIRNLLNETYYGIGQFGGGAVRPTDIRQPTVQNPVGLSPPYHPQPGREIFFQLTYKF